MGASLSDGSNNDSDHDKCFDRLLFPAFGRKRFKKRQNVVDEVSSDVPPAALPVASTTANDSLSCDNPVLQNSLNPALRSLSSSQELEYITKILDEDQVPTDEFVLVPPSSIYPSRRSNLSADELQRPVKRPKAVYAGRGSHFDYADSQQKPVQQQLTHNRAAADCSEDSNSVDDECILRTWSHHATESVASTSVSHICSSESIQRPANPVFASIEAPSGSVTTESRNLFVPITDSDDEYGKEEETGRLSSRSSGDSSIPNITLKPRKSALPSLQQGQSQCWFDSGGEFVATD